MCTDFEGRWCTLYVQIYLHTTSGTSDKYPQTINSKLNARLFQTAHVSNTTHVHVHEHVSKCRLHYIQSH